MASRCLWKYFVATCHNLGIGGNSHQGIRSRQTAKHCTSKITVTFTIGRIARHLSPGNLSCCSVKNIISTARKINCNAETMAPIVFQVRKSEKNVLSSSPTACRAAAFPFFPATRRMRQFIKSRNVSVDFSEDQYDFSDSR